LTPRRFDYRAFVTDWRSLAADHGLDPLTGEYTYADDPLWWAKRPEAWHDPGLAHSRVEAEAIRNIAAAARAAQGVKPAQTLAQAMTAEFRQIVREVLREEHTIPLRELHARRGETVADVAGMRMIVPIKVA